MTPKKTDFATQEDLAFCKTDVKGIIDTSFRNHEKVESLMYSKTLDTLSRIETSLIENIKEQKITNDDFRKKFHDITNRITLNEKKLLEDKTGDNEQEHRHRKEIEEGFEKRDARIRTLEIRNAWYNGALALFGALMGIGLLPMIIQFFQK